MDLVFLGEFCEGPRRRAKFVKKSTEKEKTMSIVDVISYYQDLWHLE